MASAVQSVVAPHAAHTERKYAAAQPSTAGEVVGTFTPDKCAVRWRWGEQGAVGGKREKQEMAGGADGILRARRSPRRDAAAARQPRALSSSSCAQPLPLCNRLLFISHPPHAPTRDPLHPPTPSLPPGAERVVDTVRGLFRARSMQDYCDVLPGLARDVVWGAPAFFHRLSSIATTIALPSVNGETCDKKTRDKTRNEPNPSSN